jgi:hypothetical protein
MRQAVKRGRHSSGLISFCLSSSSSQRRFLVLLAGGGAASGKVSGGIVSSVEDGGGPRCGNSEGSDSCAEEGIGGRMCTEGEVTGLRRRLRQRWQRLRSTLCVECVCGRWQEMIIS